MTTGFQVLRIENLSKTYGNLHAVKDLSFSVKQGEIFGLLGPNGAGKTTTLECLLGTRKPDSGELHLFGYPLSHFGRELFEEIGVQFQDSHYPELIRVGELCRLTESLYKKETENWKKLLKKFDLAEKTKKRVSELSGGERQKLSIILALINRPKLILLDELTTGLDPAARREVWEYLFKLKEKGLTILLSSHFMDEVSYLCDRILILNKGRNIVQGTPESVIESSGRETLEDAYLHYIEKKGEISESLDCIV